MFTGGGAEGVVVESVAVAAVVVVVAVLFVVEDVEVVFGRSADKLNCALLLE